MNKLSGPLVDGGSSDTNLRAIAPSLEKRRLRAYVLLMLFDAVLINLAFASAGLLYEGYWWRAQNMLAAQTLLPVYFTIALYNQTYGGRALDDWMFASRQALTALVISAALLNFVAFYTKSNAEFSRVSVTLGFMLSVVTVVGLRRLVPVVIERFWGGRTSNRLIIDDGGPSFDLDNSLRITSAEFELDPTSHDPFMLDRLGKLLQNQDKVVVSTPQERREAWAFLLKSSGVYGEVVSEPAHSLGAIGVHRYEVQDRTTLVISTGPLALRSRISKRLFDIVLAGGALVVLSPLLLFIAARIKLEDGGPVLFVQRRLGRGNQFFNMLKFRSMKVEQNDANGDRSTARDDDRVTKIGAFIRRTSIDELPQIINVLRGDMAIVGPRPHALGSQAGNKLFWEVDAQYWRRHCLKPGLTGLAQVRGHRGATAQEKDLTDRLQSDLEYISGWSLRRDIEIVWRTIFVLRHDNAF
ncbi:probable glycosyl transferase [Erythrobacter sp. NAP1]|uniref:exopolysaccharide biosynthesis polyprenyl glycosylphosphotransferase n=1 Tax=Erythrobacter sp. NAP1 TaxID=237727 RepID=UPI00006876E8|nr:exopolysaccharide biosynthesis polyprenyl glycosylphosphotransferase [Erythrobacter sp. NAP1]EAQ28698.1 probable glycosyl transferase [Erythrobacter sp. NAP1]